jgi:NAD(P)-dependent dehydrogenase (short-subunit alcohol dehydrogenase family)
MNIVVIGGGEPGKFGHDFCSQAKAHGHTVYVLSHKKYNTCDSHHMYADFTDTDNVRSKFLELTASLDQIDLFVYCTNNGAYPDTVTSLASTGQVDQSAWQYSMDVHVIIPHILSLEALKKMNESCAIVYMTTGLSYDFSIKTTEYSKYVGYSGLKGVQNHLMIGLADHNDKGAIVTSVASHFMYDQPDRYRIIFDQVYEYMTTLTKTNTGKIRQIWPDNLPKDVN